MSFSEWFNEREGFSLRSERAIETLGDSAEKWLAAAYNQALKDAARVADTTAKDYDNEWNRSLGKSDDLVEACNDIAKTIREMKK